MSICGNPQVFPQRPRYQASDFTKIELSPGDELFVECLGPHIQQDRQHLFAKLLAVFGRVQAKETSAECEHVSSPSPPAGLPIV